MHHQDRFGLRGRRKSLGDTGGIKTAASAKIQNMRGDAHRLGHISPAISEQSRHNDDHLITCRKRVEQSGLPCGMAVTNVHRNVMLGPRHRLEIRRKCFSDLNQFALINIGRRAVHRLQNAVWHNRRTGNSEVVATVGKRCHCKYP